jgi:taurine--2-oxoglutarate transaminase
LCCAAGVAAIETYQHENLIERSRELGQRWFNELQQLQQRHAIIGDVRGGDGLFAVIELVRERDAKTPLSPWPDLHPALKQLVKKALEQGVSFATRGNLIILAPPLVINENDLADATRLLDRLIGEMVI